MIWILYGYLIASAIFSVAVVILGYRINAAKYRTPLREDEWAAYAQPTMRTR